ncbi:hypothetical protein AB0C74_35535 [Spirillospora sp. NPDC048832]
MERATRMRELIAPLMQDEELGQFLRISVDDSGEVDPATLLYPVIFASDFDRGPYQHVIPTRPVTITEIRRELSRVDVPPSQMVPFLALILATDFVYLGSAGPLGEDEAKVIASDVVDILGPSVRWWSNVDFPTWSWEYGDFSGDFTASPLTGHTYDCAMVGIGEGVAVIFLSYVDD